MRRKYSPICISPLELINTETVARGKFQGGNPCCRGTHPLFPDDNKLVFWIDNWLGENLEGRKGQGSVDAIAGTHYRVDGRGGNLLLNCFISWAGQAVDLLAML